MPSPLIEVRISVHEPQLATRLAEDLVGEGLSASVQVLGPVATVYESDSTVERIQEWLLVATTTQEQFPAIKTLVLQRHSYDVPACAAVPVVATTRDYEDWVRAKTTVR